MSNQDVFPVLIDYLPEFAIRKLKEELNESPERKVTALQELRSLLKDNEKTSGIDFHEDFLIQYLRHSKYRTRDSVQRLQNFVVLNKKESCIFKSIPDDYFETTSSKGLVLLPKRCPDGCAIIMFQLAKWNPKELPLEAAKQFIFMLFYQLLRDPMNQINGIKSIYDFQDSLHLMKFCTPKNLYLLYNVAINCLPGRWMQIHFINESVIQKVIWNMVKHFLTPKIKDRVFFHSNPSGLLDHFPHSIIPTSYGGTLQDPDLEDWIRKANREHEKYSVAGQSNYYSC